MDIKNFKEVTYEELRGGEKEPLVLYQPTPQGRAVLIRFKDIPWAILNTPNLNRALIKTQMDCFICSTLGNTLIHMEQAPFNYIWRSRLLDLEEQLETGKITPQVVEYARYE